MAFWMMGLLKKLEDEISAWPDISVYPHRFGGREFLFGNADVGHMHEGGIVDVLFPRSIHDALLADGLAEGRRWVPNSAGITFRVRSEDDLKHALWLMRLSYIRYALKTAADPRGLLEQETEELHLSPQSGFCSKSLCLRQPTILRRSHSQQHSRFSRRSEWNLLFLPKT
jgi:hypothetical protein